MANYVDFTIAGNKKCTDAVGARDYCGPRAYKPGRDRLYRNDGNGRFTDVTEPAGIASADGTGLGVVTGDCNDDGWLDLYVANDATPNQLWINQRNGTFVDDGIALRGRVERGRQPRRQHGHRLGRLRSATATRISSSPTSSARPSSLYRNDGSGNFEDAARGPGLVAATAGFTGFGTDWFDYDNDGWLDLFFANGAVNVDRIDSAVSRIPSA